MKVKYTNNLINETSPYLLQHAHNPVHWQAWHQKVLYKAQHDNKLLLISIGYAACHWCHVMEHECFEDEEVAQTMNSHFVNIKIDREERPDIDHIYMDALQMMTGSGGWPLNIVALPDGRPFWGATYVKKEDWIQVLNQLQNLYETDPDKIIGYAENMKKGLIEINTVTADSNIKLLNTKDIHQIVQKWSTYFDTFLGGYKRAPKFMMPVNLNFLLHYAVSEKNEAVKEYVNTTLTRMAWGGIFDHVGGGFSRYAVDTKWHVPHFEKMLYDNGQLLSLYANAYAATGNELYKETVIKTIAFLEQELLYKNGAFYASLDADSLTEQGKLVEGDYYVWKEATLKNLLDKDYEIFKDYFNINSYGYWEEGNYVLIKDDNQDAILKKHDLDQQQLDAIITACLYILKKERNKRKRPRLDDKILTSWNGLALKGLTDAYRYLEIPKYLDMAENLAEFIANHLTQKEGLLFHSFKNSQASIHGFLEDYAAVIQGYLGLYEVTYNKKWLTLSLELSTYVIEHFSDASTGLFFFTSNQENQLIRKTLEVADNVIPSSNSVMAYNLFKLSNYYPERDFKNRFEQMLASMNKTTVDNPQSHANWMHLALLNHQKTYEVAIIGKDFKKMSKKLQKKYLPHVTFAGALQEGELSLTKGRHIANKTLFYVCEKGSCQLPKESIEDVLNIVTT